MKDLAASRFNFDLFLSFSSRDRVIEVDGKRVQLIEELKRTLESHYKPTGKAKLSRQKFRVCTYEEDFELEPTVRDAMQETIKRCAALLVVSSVSASQSEHVQFELRTFTELHGQESLLAARLSLAPDRAFPGLFTEDRLAANITPTPAITLKEWRLQLLRESHKIVAKVWSLPLTVVYNRFEQQRKQQRRLIVEWSSVAVILIFAVFTWYNTDAGFHQISVLPGEGIRENSILAGFVGSTDDEFITFHQGHLHRWQRLCCINRKAAVLVSLICEEKENQAHLPPSQLETV